MDRWVYFNPNPAGNRVGDCAVRAICKALELEWETVFTGLMVQACALSCIDGHVVTVQDGKYYDTWDSGNEIPVYYWEKE